MCCGVNVPIKLKNDFRLNVNKHKCAVTNFLHLSREVLQRLRLLKLSLREGFSAIYKLFQANAEIKANKNTKFTEKKPEALKIEEIF